MICSFTRFLSAFSVSQERRILTISNHQTLWIILKQFFQFLIFWCLNLTLKQAYLELHSIQKSAQSISNIQSYSYPFYVLQRKDQSLICRCQGISLLESFSQSWRKWLFELKKCHSHWTFRRWIDQYKKQDKDYSREWGGYK